MMDVNMNACYTCLYYNLKDCFCGKYLRGKENAVFLCPDCKSRPSAQPDYDLSGYSDRLWKSAYERGKNEGQPERRGKWIKDGETYALYKCSACNEICPEAGWANCIKKEQMYKTFKFCPHCGARMEEQE